MGATSTLHERSEQELLELLELLELFQPYPYSAIVQFISFLLRLNKVSLDKGCEWCGRIKFPNTEKSAIPDVNKRLSDNVKLYVTQV